MQRTELTPAMRGFYIVGRVTKTLFNRVWGHPRKEDRDGELRGFNRGSSFSLYGTERGADRLDRGNEPPLFFAQHERKGFIDGFALTQRVTAQVKATGLHLGEVVLAGSTLSREGDEAGGHFPQ